MNNVQENGSSGLSTSYCSEINQYTSQPITNRPLMRKIEITSLDRGFVVKVGCQDIAISDKIELLAQLTRYITDPAQTEKDYNEGKLFK